MNFVEAVKIRKRMCDRYIADGIACNGCPLDEIKGIGHCIDIMADNPERAEEILSKWAEENQEMTNAEAANILQRIIDDSGIYGNTKLTEDAVKAIMIGIEALENDRNNHSE